jgi:hypothetical protein
MTETRKLAAILVADVVGHSRLAGADEERTLARLRRCAATSSILRSRCATAGLAVNPAFTIFRARAAWTAISGNPTYLNELVPVLEGLRKAGLPEQ